MTTASRPVESVAIDVLTDFDFLELVAFDRKVDSEGFTYAVENYAPVFERDGYVPCRDTRTLQGLRRKYADYIDRFWSRPDACDLHNAHIDESDRRERERALQVGGER